MSVMYLTAAVASAVGFTIAAALAIFLFIDHRNRNPKESK